MTKALIIQNPHAHSGEGTEQRDKLRAELTTRLSNALHLDSVDWRETEHPNHAKTLAEEGTRAGYEYIFAGGGDGTINEVLNGIMSVHFEAAKRPIMGVLPFGTSNDFFAALKFAESSHKSIDPNTLTLALDVGQITFDGLERFFCLTTALGLFSWANEQYLDASHVFGRRFAHIPAAIKAAISYRFRPNIKIAHDGLPSHKRRALSVVINNSPVISGGIALTPDARIDDGQFDVCIVRPVSLPRLIWLLLEIGTKTHTHSRAVQLGRVREITITARQALPVQIDGELIPEIDSKARQVIIKVLPAALRIVVPSLCELTSEAPVPAAAVVPA